MQHMGCEPDRASYNIMVDAYGRAGLHSGNKKASLAMDIQSGIILSISEQTEPELIKTSISLKVFKF